MPSEACLRGHVLVVTNTQSLHNRVVEHDPVVPFAWLESVEAGPNMGEILRRYLTRMVLKE